MHIVQVANLVTPTSGGIRTCIGQLGRHYLAQGHTRTVVVPGPRPALEHHADGTRRLELPGRRLPASGGYRVLTDRSLLRTTLEALEPDALEIHDRLTLPWVCRWARQLGIPATVVVHERLATPLRTFGRLGPLAGPVERSANRRLLRSTGGVVVASRYSAAGFGHDPRVEVVPLGVDRARFRPLGEVPSSTRRNTTASTGLRLVVVSRLSAEKRTDLAIEVSRILHRQGVAHHLDVFGDGPTRPLLTRRARGLPVRLHGAVPAERVAGALAAADLALATCPHETFGLAALEALACGTAIVTPDRGAVPELLGAAPGTPHVGPAGATSRGDAPSMAAAVLALREIDPTARRRAATAVAARYDWATTARHLLRRHAGHRAGVVEVPHAQR